MRQAIRQSDREDREPKNFKREGWVLGAPLILSLENDTKNTFKYLWDARFVNVWG